MSLPKVCKWVIPSYVTESGIWQGKSPLVLASGKQETIVPPFCCWFKKYLPLYGCRNCGFSLKRGCNVEERLELRGDLCRKAERFKELKEQVSRDFSVLPREELLDVSKELKPKLRQIQIDGEFIDLLLEDYSEPDEQV